MLLIFDDDLFVDDITPVATSGNEDSKDTLSMTEVDEFIDDLNNQQVNQDGFETVDVQSFHLTGKQTPEIVALLNEKVEPLTEQSAKIKVYQYTPNIQEWSTVHEEEMPSLYTPLQFIESGTISGDLREQVAIGYWEGSGKHLSFLLVGSSDAENVTSLLNLMDEPFYEGRVKFTKNHLLVTSSDQVTKTFKWDENKLTEQ